MLASIKGFIGRSKVYAAYGDARFRLINRLAAGESYFITKDGSFDKTSNKAVVLHLYYPETWEEVFASRLTLLAKKTEFDLFITMPEVNRAYSQAVRSVFPNANILVAPNRGRDVLPFIKAAALLNEMGYEKVLKIHGKRSKHRETSNTAAAGSGDAWLLSTLDALIPKDSKTLDDVVSKVNSKKTGMIGALDYYYPIKMYLGHNRTIIERIVNRIDDTFFRGVISRKVEDVGFFGGTMFWVDLNVIADTLGISKHNFQKEKGQTDGTIAHALERVFCMLPQLKGMDVFGVTGQKVVKIKPGDGVIPDWYYADVSFGKPPISIIVPVYADWPSLSKNIQSLKKIIGNSEDVSVHYVNDCSPEADSIENNILHNIGGLTNFYYYRNDHNLGFVQTCNRATLKLVGQNDDVLLLNSDTKVTKNFVFAMRSVLYSEPNIGAVTSRSNNATIWSVPMNSRLANYRWASYLLYRLIRRSLPEKYITPTIHGFCVLIRREVITKFGLFDEIYGKGYGEENDFAMRLRSKGWKCAAANYSFVFHYESRSFGKDVRNKQIEHNEVILTQRYPEYRQLVQQYWDATEEPLK